MEKWREKLKDFFPFLVVAVVCAALFDGLLTNFVAAFIGSAFVCLVRHRMAE